MERYVAPVVCIDDFEPQDIVTSSSDEPQAPATTIDPNLDSNWSKSY